MVWLLMHLLQRNRINILECQHWVMHRDAQEVIVLTTEVSTTPGTPHCIVTVYTMHVYMYY